MPLSVCGPAESGVVCWGGACEDGASWARAEGSRRAKDARRRVAGLQRDLGLMLMI